ncbi:hypothetical protein OJAV_G00136590 [Oryzias javanicus]|uniref:Uncharacterized protein n=1 Tax=Oryzias javanicus TaxID=123683 RepID=A0A437CL40_ORYJA|nr:hypothetical protein OJAV_G00136590 [Oryzias javanicus]
MANYRTKLRGFGIPEVMCNSLKNKSPANRKSAKAEVNYLPPYPPGEDEESLEQERILLLTEVMKRDNAMVIKDMMARTFPHRRNDVIIKSLGIEDLKSRWPALFEPCHLKEEFQRITMMPLLSTFMENLDKYTPRLMALFDTKGGTTGLSLQTILCKAPSNPSIGVTRDVAIRGLVVYLGESLHHLLKEYDVCFWW